MTPAHAAPGPSGAAGLPPAWLAMRGLPLLRLPQGTRFYRIHQLANDAVFFGPVFDPPSGKRHAPTHRFDSLAGIFGVLYVAEQFEGAFVETVLRNPELGLVSEKYIAMRAVSELLCSCELKLVDLRGRGLSRVGATNAISTGPYEPCWAWSDYLWSHRDRPDGIAYTSRHNPRQICYAIFGRPHCTFTAGPPTPLTNALPTINSFLRRYDKILIRS